MIKFGQNRNRLAFWLVAATLQGMPRLLGGVGEVPPADSRQAGAAGASVNLLTGEGVSLNGILFPHFHASAAYGDSSAESAADLAVGHHDPEQSGWNLQNIEAGLSARFSERLEAFGVYAMKLGAGEDWVGEFEEYFVKAKELPGNLELRLGRYYNRFGLQNTYHPHGFDWVDQYLVNGRFLGEDSLTTEGGEITWTLPLPWTSLLSISGGRAPRAGEHGHHEEGEADHRYEAEGAAIQDRIFAVNSTSIWGATDFREYRAGLSAAWGENAWDRLSQIYGAHFQFDWRENGLESGGSYVRWRTEGMFRSIDAMSGHLPGEKAEPGSFDEYGCYSSLVYGRPISAGTLELGVRYEYVSGVSEAGLDGRHRMSPAITWYPLASRTLQIRGQYNHDIIPGRGSEDSVWLGVSLNWGGAEVR